MTLRFVSAAAFAALMIGGGAARAEDALQTLQGMHMTAPIDWPTVPQTGPKADAVKQILTKIQLPPGFHIDLYALVPDARHMAVGPQGVVTFVGTRKNKIWAVTDRNDVTTPSRSTAIDPLLPFKIAYERAVSARKRSPAEGVPEGGEAKAFPTPISSSLTFPAVHRWSSTVSSHSHERNLTDGRLREPKSTGH